MLGLDLWAKVVLAVGIVAAGFISGWVVNGWRLEARIASIQAFHAKAYAKAQEQARSKETALNDELAKLRKTKDAQIKTINSRLANALNGLRDRPERTELPKNPASCDGSTGAQLARGDAEFLARYAADAARLQTSYETCVRAYEAARKAVE